MAYSAEGDLSVAILTYRSFHNATRETEQKLRLQLIVFWQRKERATSAHAQNKER